MEAAKHIPGPWRVFNHSWSDTSILADGFDHGICLLDINHATEESQEADEAVMAANARLIAAAPELLAACQAIVEYQRLAESDETYGLLNAYAKAFEASIAAVAKATGEPA
jgi:hypothetical protein